MCGRVGVITHWQDRWSQTRFDRVPEPIERYNIAPSRYRRKGDPASIQWSQLPVLRDREGQRCVEMLVWPLIPHWMRGALPEYNTANCRSEPDTPFSRVAARKPAFRHAWNKQQRCIVLVSFFYEWDQRSKPKQPWRVAPAHEPFLALAGLWEQSTTDEGQTRQSCTIITTEPNRLLSDIGHHRGPVMLSPEEWDTWLTGEPETAEAVVARAYPSEALEAQRVSRAVNNPDYDDPALMEPA